MKFYKLLNTIVVLLLVLTLTSSPRIVSAQEEILDDPGEYVPGEIVVIFKSGLTPEAYSLSADFVAEEVGLSLVEVSDEGVALMRGDSRVEVDQLIASVITNPDVLTAEPNYIYRLPELETSPDLRFFQEDVALRRSINPATGEEQKLAVPTEYLKSLKSIRNGKIMATYPNDPYLWWNWGWDDIDADIVSPNTTPSVGVCVLDTGVDYLHPDLAGRVIKGYDYVNGDSIPMDDNGHGTHVAGIITAIGNNKIGIAGASNAMVVAVKVLGAQGWGTSYDIAMGINYCAKRRDVKVLSMSLGGSHSQAIEDAVDYAVNTKGKLLVAAAGNDDTDDYTYAYPAALSLTYPGKVLSVAASGAYEYVDYDDDGYWDYYYLDGGCRADYSNYGDWVNIIAPGTDIYSTLPYDKPFYLNYFYGYNPRYDGLSGTSMATPFVAAAAARNWGYKPASTNVEVFDEVVNSGWSVYGDGACWPVSMDGTNVVNIANLLDRFSFEASVADASTGLGLTGAKVNAYKDGVLVGKGKIVPQDWGYTWLKGQIIDEFKYYTAYTDVINLPEPTNGKAFYEDDNGYKYKVVKSGYTTGAQEVFRHELNWFGVATLYMMERASVPPKSSNIEVVTGFVPNIWNAAYNIDYRDLDLDVWLPSMPNPLDANQPAPFIVGLQGWSFGYLEGEPFGSMTAFPFARYKREGGWMDYVPIENVTISSRKAHGKLLANAALPYYPGDYVVGVTDWGQTFDHDDDELTAEVPVMGAGMVPYVYIWKDGVIKLFNMMDYLDGGDPCNVEWWRAATISSGLTGSTKYTPNNACNADPSSIFPYYISD